MAGSVRVATLNLHKGFLQFNRRMVMHEQRAHLTSLAPDLAFLQEVQGAHRLHEERHRHWPDLPHHEFLADKIWDATAYGRNAVYPHGHHGNAILSRFPILYAENQDISAHSFEHRGVLHCEMIYPETGQRFHCLNVHLGLTAKGRRFQLDAICARIRRLIPDEEPVIVAGDFNDWRRRADHLLASELGLIDVFRFTRGKNARTFPALLPMLALDRIYIRGFNVANAAVHFVQRDARLSDHGALVADLEFA